MPWAFWCVVTGGLDLLVLKKYKNGIFRIFNNLMAIVNVIVIHNVVAVRLLNQNLLREHWAAKCIIVEITRPRCDKSVRLSNQD